MSVEARIAGLQQRLSEARSVAEAVMLAWDGDDVRGRTPTVSITLHAAIQGLKLWLLGLDT